jgi:hypothetical protein
MKLLFAACVLVVLTGTAQAQKKVHVQRDFILRAGSGVIVKEAKLKLTFVALVEDSRCPEGVDCIWAGNGKISLTVRKGRQKSVSFDLNTTTEPKSFIFQCYEITLVNLAPYPKNNSTTKKEDYVATLKVTLSTK